MNTSAFDTAINRFGTYSASWDCLAEQYGSDFISLGIAEMDFETCPDVKRAIIEAAQRGIYSYTEVFPAFGEACATWFTNRHHWSVQPEHVIFAPRIIELIASLLTHVYPESRLGTFSPYYTPIVNVASRSTSQVIDFPLTTAGIGDWEINFDQLDHLFATIDLFILTNPHNPTGRCWSRAELETIARMADRHHVTIISDDIHSDIVHPGHTWIPIAAVVSDLGLDVDVITCVSPAKSFNIAGIETSAAIVEKADLRREIQAALYTSGIHNPNYFAMPAAIAAWSSDGTWMDDLNSYIRDNHEYVIQRFADELPELKFYMPDATYLLWGYSPSLLPDSAACTDVSNNTGVIFNAGENYGDLWAGYIRLAIAVPKSRLEIATDRVIEHFQRRR